jgi:hypothetical protein
LRAAKNAWFGAMPIGISLAPDFSQVVQGDKFTLNMAYLDHRTEVRR